MLNNLGKFEADLFVMTNSKEFIKNTTYQMPAHEHLFPNASGVATLSHVPVASTISIYGGTDAAGTSNGGIVGGTLKFTATNSTPGSGEYKLDTSGATPTITFYQTDVDNTVGIHIDYYYEETAEEANIDNRSSAIGEAILVYPVKICGFIL